MNRTAQRQRKAEMQLLETRLQAEFGLGIRDFMIKWSEDHPGGHLQDLAEIFDCHLSTVYRYLDYFGLETLRTLRIVPRGTAA